MIETIVLIGYRAVGKTTIGKMLAEQLSYTFIDTDQQICEQRGASISQIVERHGWPVFRQHERDTLQRITQMSKVVVSTGGGAIAHKDLFAEIKSYATVIWLFADVDTIVSRMTIDETTGQKRPPLTSGPTDAEVRETLEQREPLYRAAADFSIDSSKETAEQVVEEIKRFFLGLQGKRGR